MTLNQILIAIVITAVAGIFTRKGGRQPILLALSALAIYWLQPNLRIPALNFWIPTTTIIITVVCWLLTSTPECRSIKEHWPSVLILAGVIIFVLITPIIGFNLLLTESQLPHYTKIIIVILGIVLLTGFFMRIPRRYLLWVSLVIIILLLIILKVTVLRFYISSLLRALSGLPTTQTSAIDIQWLGFSYIAFRLLHTIRDRQTGRLPPVNLGEYVTYMIFFPALTAGPIDRIERFIKDLRQPSTLPPKGWEVAIYRSLLGLFKKFVLADYLALISLNSEYAKHVHPGLPTWLLLYAYGLQIYFDFSGYTDIALGLAQFVGVTLPENFKSPYLKSNLTQFWNSWHMTLTQWFRAYFFNPLVRALQTGKRWLPISLSIFIAQVSTMVLIGLWHGVTWNFMFWGLWHGIGLFIQNRWSDLLRKHPIKWLQQGRFKAISNIIGVLITFHYVTIGWVFFALPNLPLSWAVIQKLFIF